MCYTYSSFYMKLQNKIQLHMIFASPEYVELWWEHLEQWFWMLQSSPKLKSRSIEIGGKYSASTEWHNIDV
jgi:hypothetical protein